MTDESRESLELDVRYPLYVPQCTTDVRGTKCLMAYRQLELAEAFLEQAKLAGRNAELIEFANDAQFLHFLMQVQSTGFMTHVVWDKTLDSQSLQMHEVAHVLDYVRERHEQQQQQQ